MGKKIDNCISDTFRARCAGNVHVPMNSKSATDNFHVDRSRLGTHTEWDPDKKNDYGGMGAEVEVHNSVMDNVRGAMGGLGACSSFRDVQAPKDDSRPPSPYGGYRPKSNPLMRRKGD